MNGINFIQPLFHAVVEGRKTMTRRVMKPQPDDNGLHDHTKFPMSDHPSYDREGFWGTVEETGESKQFKPRYKVGETLYLKEPYKIELCEGKYKVFFDYSKNVIDLPQSVSPEGILKVQNSMRKSKSGYCNKLFVVKGLPEYFPYRIEITGVKAERLQDISDEDCLREGILEWVEDWVSKTYHGYVYDDQHWINDKIDGYDQSISYCRKCAEKEVKRLVKNYVKKGHPKDEAENYVWVEGGGYGEDSDTEEFCETCGKPLFYAFVGDIYEYMKDADFDFDKCFAFFLEACGYRKQWETPFVKAGYLKKAFAALIDKIKRGTWDSNPFMWVYEFKLVKPNEL